MSVNKVILLGHVGKAPEVKVFDGGTKKASFTLATSEKYTDRNGEVHENTEWHNIVCWRKTADVVEKYVGKGTQVYIEGKITTRSYEGQDGIKRYVTEIEVMSLQLLGRKDGDGQGQAQGGYAAPAYQAPQQVYQAAPAPVPLAAPVASDPNSLESQSDDLPF